MKKLNVICTPLSARPEHIAEYRRVLRDMGEDPDAYRVAALAFVYVNEDRERAYYEFEEPCMWYFRTLARLIPAVEYPAGHEFYQGLHGSLSEMLAAYDRGELTFQQIADEGPFSHGFLVGDPDSVSAKLQSMLDMYGGLTDVLCWTRLGGLDHHKVMGSMERFVTKVTDPLKAGAQA